MQTISKKSGTSTRSHLSRSQKLLNHLLRGRTINGKQALTQFGIYRLSAAIHVYRKRGFTIETKMVQRNGSKYGVYKLTEAPKAQA